MRNIESKGSTATTSAKKKTKLFERLSVQIMLLAILPTLLAIFAERLLINWINHEANVLIDTFTQNLYDDQISHSKMLNMALVIQIGSQVQRMQWRVNMLAMFWKRVHLGQIIKNSLYNPAILNVEATYFQTGDPQLLEIYRKSSILISSWTTPNYMDQHDLDPISQQQIYQGETMASLWREIKYQNIQNESNTLNDTQMKIRDILLGFSYDGMGYVTGVNSTYSEFVIPPGCPIGKYRLDLRCRPYYAGTMQSPSVRSFINLFHSGEGFPFLAAIFCSRTPLIDPLTGKFQVHSLMCIILDLTVISTFMANFRTNSQFQIILDPFEQNMIYHSERKLGKTEIISFWDLELKYLEDQKQAQIFQENIVDFGNQLYIQKMQSIDLKTILANQEKTNQKSFSYIKNGTECLVIMNRVTMLDYIHLEADQISMNAKYLETNVFLFIDVLTKEQLTVQGTYMKDQVSSTQQIFTIITVVFIAIGILFQIPVAIKFSNDIMKPIIHLTEILKTLHFPTVKSENNSQFNHKTQGNLAEVTSPNIPNAKNTLNFNSTGKKLTSQTNPNISKYGQSAQHFHTEEHQSKSSEQSHPLHSIFQEQQFDRDAENLCLSKDTQSLFNSFRSLFLILRFTTQSMFEQNQSISLLNLSTQIEHFKQLKNYRAIGVCHNNMAGIHYNCQRYKEALENYQIAVIYAKYELDFYAPDKDCYDESSLINHHNQVMFLRNTELDRSHFDHSQNHRFIEDPFNKNELIPKHSQTIQMTQRQRKSKEDQQLIHKELTKTLIKDTQKEQQFQSEKIYQSQVLQNSMEKYIKETAVNQRNFTTPRDSREILVNNKLYQQQPQEIDILDQNEMKQLWWNLFNRKFNFAKALYSYMSDNQHLSMWPQTEMVIRELFEISSSRFLPPSLKREMNLLYYLALTFFKQAKFEEFNVALVAYEEMYKRYQWIKLKKQRRSDLIGNNNPEIKGGNVEIGELSQLNQETPSYQERKIEENQKKQSFSDDGIKNRTSKIMSDSEQLQYSLTNPIFNMLSGSKKPLENNKILEESIINKHDFGEKSLTLKEAKYINIPNCFKPKMLTIEQIQEIPYFTCLPQKLLLFQQNLTSLHSNQGLKRKQSISPMKYSNDQSFNSPKNGQLASEINHNHRNNQNFSDFIKSKTIKTRNQKHTSTKPNSFFLNKTSTHERQEHVPHTKDLVSLNTVEKDPLEEGAELGSQKQNFIFSKKYITLLDEADNKPKDETDKVDDSIDETKKDNLSLKESQFMFSSKKSTHAQKSILREPLHHSHVHLLKSKRKSIHLKPHLYDNLVSSSPSSTPFSLSFGQQHESKRSKTFFQNNSKNIKENPSLVFPNIPSLQHHHHLRHLQLHHHPQYSSIHSAFESHFNLERDTIMEGYSSYKRNHQKVQLKFDAKSSAQYEFKSDIFAQIYTLLASIMLTQQKQLKEAAILLTEQLENSYLYLPHLKKKILQNLKSAFDLGQISNPILNEMCEKYDESENMIIRVCLISTSVKFHFKQRTVLLAEDILNQVLIKDLDQLGIISYSRIDNLYSQKAVFRTRKNLIKDNNRFADLYDELFLEDFTQKAHKSSSCDERESDSLLLLNSNTNRFKSINNLGQKTFPFLDKIISEEVINNRESAENNKINYSLTKNNNNSFGLKVNLDMSREARSASYSQFPSPRIERSSNYLVANSLIPHNSDRGFLRIENVSPSFSYVQNDIQGSFQSMEVDILDPKHQQFLNQKDQSKIDKISKSSLIPELANDQDNLDILQKINPFKHKKQNNITNLTLSIPKDSDNEHTLKQFQSQEQFIEVEVIKSEELAAEDEDTHQHPIRSRNKHLINPQEDQSKYYQQEPYQQFQATSKKLLETPFFNMNEFTYDANQLMSKIPAMTLVSSQTPKDIYPTCKILPEDLNSFSKINYCNEEDVISQAQPPPISNHFRPYLLKLHQKINETPIEKSFTKYKSDLNYHEDKNSLKNNLNNPESNNFFLRTPSDYETKTLHNEQKQKQSLLSFLNSEECIFHRGIHFALKRYILNSSERITLYAAHQRQARKEEQQLLTPDYNIMNTIYGQAPSKSNESSNFTHQKTYLIYTTDQFLVISNKKLYYDLCVLLYNLQTELLVLLGDSNQTAQELSFPQDQCIQSRQVITYFSSATKLLQYMYNLRDHINHRLYPTTVEQFQTNFLLIVVLFVLIL